MLQEEVANRVASPPGSKEYGILSVLYGLHADVAVRPRFPPGAFHPAPESRFRRAPRGFSEVPRVAAGPFPAFEKLVQTAFARRRRTLENDLQDSYPNLSST